MWEADEFVTGPGTTGYNESATVTAWRGLVPPTYPSTNVGHITWLILEQRYDWYTGSFTGQITSGTASITILPTPDDIWADVFEVFNNPAVEPATLSGYVSPDGILDRPLVIVEGYDATNTNYSSHLLGQLLEPSGSASFITALLEGGYDVFVYNHGDATVSLRANAMRVLGALIALNGYVDTTPPLQRQPIRVMGLSLGGVVTRYALAWAEVNGYDHGCDMFISADAPQQGAWLNYDFQQWLEDHEGDHPTVTMLASGVKSQAAKELLRLNVFDTPGSMPDGMQEIEGTDMYEVFYDELNAFNGNGYPHRTRNIGISFGKGNIKWNMPEEDIQGLYAQEWVGTHEIASVDVRINEQTIIRDDIEFETRDIWSGSYQPAFQPQTIAASTLLWDGTVWLFRFIDPLFLHYRVTLGEDGPPAFINAESALDLWGVARAGVRSERITGWNYTKFDELYMDPVKTNWHNKLSEDLGAAIVAKLLDEGPEVVAPPAGVLHPNGSDLVVRWKWRAASTVDIALSSNGGQTFVNIVQGGSLQPSARCTPTDANSDGCYTVSAPHLPLSQSSESVIRVTSHYPGGGSVTQQLSDEFTIWGIDEASIVCVPSFSCNAPTLSMQFKWNTPIATDGQDEVEVYKPGDIPGINAPQTVTGTSQGTYHVVTWHGPCQVGTWLFRVKSTKVGSGTSVSNFKVRSVTECASCPPPCNPPCELE